MAKFYRGLAVLPQDRQRVMHAIDATGVLARSPGHRTKDFPHPSVAAALLAAPKGTLRDAWAALPKSVVTYACASAGDASFYAFSEKRNGHGHGLVVEVDTAPVAVDANDFLHRAFARCDSGLLPISDIVDEVASAFGDAIRPHLMRSAEHPAADRPVLCEIACCDPAVVSAHLANSRDIHGKNDTVFRSAFLIPAVVTQPGSISFVTAPVSRTPSLPPLCHKRLFG